MYINFVEKLQNPLACPQIIHHSKKNKQATSKDYPILKFKNCFRNFKKSKWKINKVGCKNQANNGKKYLQSGIPSVCLKSHRTAVKASAKHWISVKHRTHTNIKERTYLNLIKIANIIGGFLLRKEGKIIYRNELSYYFEQEKYKTLNLPFILKGV
jgi:hypothetical protein